MLELQASTRKSLPSTIAAIIDGEPTVSKDARELPVINPDDGTELLKLSESDEATVNRAVSSARASFNSGAWSRAPIEQRQRVLQRTAELIRDNAQELAALDSLSTGLLYHSSTYGQAYYAAAGWFQYFAGLIGTTGEDLYRQLPDTRAFVTREPVGVAGLFTPWNIPVMGASLKLSAALAMGNSCVLKPSEQSPLGAARLVELIHEAGLPPGVLQLVNGHGTVTGAALASHPDVNLVSFTGGETAGRIIATETAKRFARTTMELGGKSANVIFADADLEKALDGSLTAIYANSGQGCLAGSRILVQKSVADSFIADFVQRSNQVRVGRPFDDKAEVGPQSSKQHMERVLTYTDVVRDEGGEILTGGKRAEAFAEGFYVEPTVAVARDNSARVCQEEIFGPFATFLVFDTDEEAVEIANDTRFGLAAYLWTESLQRAMRVSDRLRSGTVLVNTPMQRERNAPFGGFGHSGIDREGGRWSLDFYSEPKTTIVPYGDQPIPTMGKS
jgi:acyl-CoA reductase-like NAD-dependent aldehyde dehydrogenase